jgi:sulfide:quinone oxidoreductase
MNTRIVVLGAGTGGTLAANRLQRELKHTPTEITVVDLDDVHVYQPGLLFVPFGLAHAHKIVRPRSQQLRRGIRYVQRPIDRVEIDRDTVVLHDGVELPYDVLIVATGAVLAPEETEGLPEAMLMDTAHHFYTMAGAEALQSALARFDHGRLVVNVVDMPIKCPVAPLEFCFLADWHFQQRGIRDRVEITYVTPLDAAFTKPVAAQTLGGLLEKKNIRLVTEFNTGSVDGLNRQIVAYDGREMPFDLAVVIPVHSGAAYVGASPGLGDELNFIPTDRHTMQSSSKPNIFAIGDATNLPASKAGSVAHFQGEALVNNVLRFIQGKPLTSVFDGHANCFIESGFGKAMLIDFNYETEPLPGHFPTSLGLPLLKQSRLNHIGKLMFQWFYWHGLLPGRDVPGIGSDMPKSGKHKIAIKPVQPVAPSDTAALADRTHEEKVS